MAHLWVCARCKNNNDNFKFILYYKANRSNAISKFKVIYIVNNNVIDKSYDESLMMMC